MPEIKLKGPAVIDGAVRYPTEGVITVSDDDADAQRANKNIEEDGEDDDGLEAMTLIDLGLLVTKEGVPLNGATKKADIVTAIRAHRAPIAAG